MNLGRQEKLLTLYTLLQELYVIAATIRDQLWDWVPSMGPGIFEEITEVLDYHVITHEETRCLDITRFPEVFIEMMEAIHSGR